MNRLRRAMNGVRTRAFIYALLAAFVAHGTLTSSHFHPVGGTGGTSIDGFNSAAQVASQTKGDVGSKHKGDDASKCPICQAVSVAGSFITATQSVFVPSISTFFVSHDERIIAVERFMASWRSRAPPAL